MTFGKRIPSTKLNVSRRLRDLHLDLTWKTPLTRLRVRTILVYPAHVHHVGLLIPGGCSQL
jgi:hypothetical protein